MAVRFAYCPFRLLFKHPFETSHGSREGTDALFIRAEEDGMVGYGEVTLPPYLKETITEAIAQLRGWVSSHLGSAEELLRQLEAETSVFQDAAGARAGLHSALLDIFSREQQQTVGQHYRVTFIKQQITLMTLGVMPNAELEDRLRELPASSALKLKVGDAGSIQRVLAVARLDGRRILLDGNQGYGTCEDVEALLGTQPVARWIGLEQPFPEAHDELNGKLAQRTGVVVFGDESIRSKADLQAKRSLFGGVNIKLMKAGGLDRVAGLMHEARRNGQQVMLGSMSESSLGCTAMAHFAGAADVVDLDGPWLIKNDPFEGIRMSDSGGLRMPQDAGIGATLKADLDFIPVGA